jgi:protein-tyrosine phosphatase
MSESRRRGVLFVCMGNICRSPTAEGVVVRLADERGLAELVRVDSAGTIAYHEGEPPDRRMTEAAAARGHTLRGRSRPVRARDFEDFDLIVAMDRENLRDLEEMPGAAPGKLRLFSDFLPPGSPVDVPDPYYGGARGFDRVLDLVEQGTPAILDELLPGDQEPG